MVLFTRKSNHTIKYILTLLILFGSDDKGVSCPQYLCNSVAIHHCLNLVDPSYLIL